MKAKNRKGKAKRAGDPPLAEDFLRGMLVGASLAAFQDVPQPASRQALKRVLRHSLQGGTALAAGSRAASRLVRDDYAGALIAAAAGAAGVFLIEQLLRGNALPSNREMKDGQEA